MASRIFWVLLAGAALVTGMMLQDGDRLFTWGHESGITRSTERAIEARVERAVESSFDKVQVVNADGRDIDVPPEMKRALGAAVGELVEAETDLALLKVRGGSSEEMKAANLRRDMARGAVDQLKTQIKAQGQAPAVDREAVRDQIREEVRETVRDAVRD